MSGENLACYPYPGTGCHHDLGSYAHHAEQVCVALVTYRARLYVYLLGMPEV